MQRDRRREKDRQRSSDWECDTRERDKKEKGKRDQNTAKRRVPRVVEPLFWKVGDLASLESLTDRLVEGHGPAERGEKGLVAASNKVALAIRIVP